MTRDIIEALEAEISTDNLLELVEQIWKIDRRFSYPAFAESAAFEAEKMRSWGLEAEVLNATADGETVVGDWRMPLAWDYERATLELVKPEEKILADTDILPTHIVMWSGPTPEEGIEAPAEFVPDADDDDAYEGRSVKGKIVLVDVDARSAKMPAHRHGAKAVVSCFNKHPEKIPDAVSWCNGWSDDPGGWAFHDGDTPVPGMNITPRQGEELKRLLEGEEEVVLRMKVASRYYKGDLALATGLLRGTDGGEEVLTLGHGHEQGANDNASGCAAMMEALRVIKSAVDKGALPRPPRSLRALITNECYGTLAFAAMKPDAVSRTLAALNVDSIGQDQAKTGGSLTICLNPHASAHYSDTLTVNLFERWMRRRNPRFSFRVKGFGLDDNLLADPAFGVPSVLIDTPGDINWHTTADTMDMVDPDNLRGITLMTAAFLYTIGSAGEDEARTLAIEGSARWLRNASDAVASGLRNALAVKGEARAHEVAQMRQKAAYLADVASAEINSTRELLPSRRLPEFGDFLAELRGSTRSAVHGLADGAARAARIVSEEQGNPLDTTPTESVDEKLLEAENVVPKRNFKGTPSFDSLPPEIRRKTPSPRWDSRLQATCFWMDGKRSLAEVVNLTVLEKGGNPVALLGQIEFMAEHGLVTIEPKAEEPSSG